LESGRVKHDVGGDRKRPASFVQSHDFAVYNRAGQEPFTGAGYLAVELLNHVGDINLDIDEFAEFPSVVSL
jgi:hypothetical protein